MTVVLVFSNTVYKCVFVIFTFEDETQIVSSLQCYPKMMNFRNVFTVIMYL